MLKGFKTPLVAAAMAGSMLVGGVAGAAIYATTAISAPQPPTRPWPL